jgi:hypothetical protein
MVRNKNGAIVKLGCEGNAEETWRKLTAVPFQLSQRISPLSHQETGDKLYLGPYQSIITLVF